MVTLIDRYILRNVATPLILALCVAAALLLLEQMLRLFDFVLAEQGPVDVVWRMLANLLPHYFGLALPLGTFLGIMLAFRNLSLSSELDALNSSGASFGRLMRPIYALVIALMALDFLLVAYVQPLAAYKYKEIRFDVTSGAFGIKIPQGEFVELTDRATVRLGEIDPATRQATDIFLERTNRDGSRTIVTAKNGALSATPELTKLILKMNDGRQLFIDADGRRLRALEFDNFDVEIALPQIDVFRPRGREDDEATFSELVEYVRANDGARDARWYDYRAGMHWAMIHPLTFLVMPILAVAMGVTGRRGSSSLKPVVGVAILIIYHELLEEWGQVVAAENVFTPYVSMWGLLAGFAALSVLLYLDSIEKARRAQAASRQARQTIRVTSEGALPSDDDKTLAREAVK